MEKEIEERIREIIEAELVVDQSEITPNAELVIDLGADSLDVVELVMKLEEEFDMCIAESEEDDLKTVDDVFQLVHRKLRTTKRSPKTVPAAG